jgi:hypothetical protein
MPELQNTVCIDCGESSESLRCESCEENFTTCDLCNEETHIDDSTTLPRTYRVHVRGAWRSADTACNRCIERYFATCDDCGETVPCCDTRSQDCRTVCDDCISDHYSYCDECSEYSHHDSPCGCSDNKSDLVNSYGYKPCPIFHGKLKGLEGYIGVELEVNTDEIPEHAETVIDMMGDDHIYLKEDGSIGSGFEIVTHPHTLEEQRKLWSQWKAPSGMTSARSGDCGIHVHYSRKGLPMLHINRMVVFLNAPENLGFIECIAQRSSNGYCKIKPKSISGKGSCDRYEALNLTNKSTIEFRIFRGNTRKSRIIKCIEFAVAVVNWTRDRSYRDLSHGNFVAWVSKNSKEYPTLSEYIKEKWLKCV